MLSITRSNTNVSGAAQNSNLESETVHNNNGGFRPLAHSCAVRVCQEMSGYPALLLTFVLTFLLTFMYGRRSHLASQQWFALRVSPSLLGCDVIIATRTTSRSFVQPRSDPVGPHQLVGNASGHLRARDGDHQAPTKTKNHKKGVGFPPQFR